MTRAGIVAVVTGANKGIGFEVARSLGATGATVYLGARQPKLGEEATARLVAEGLEVHFLELDVTSPELVSAAAARIDAEQGRLDVLVNNAATGLDFTPPSEVPDADVRTVFETNVMGPVRVIQAMLPLLRRSPAGRIVNVSSDFGSLTLTSDPTKPHGSVTSLAYTASKSALNQVTVQFANELRGTACKINSVNPGFTDTDMITSVGLQSPRTPARAAQAVVAYALLDDEGPSGGFFDEKGPLPW